MSDVGQLFVVRYLLQICFYISFSVIHSFFLSVYLSFPLQITIDILVEMTNEDLQSIGVSKFGIRHRILKKVKELLHGKSEGKIISIKSHNLKFKWIEKN